MREAAANLEFEEAARLRDEIKRLKMLDLEFANEVLTPERRGGGHGGAVKRVQAAGAGGGGGAVPEGRKSAGAAVLGCAFGPRLAPEIGCARQPRIPATTSAALS